MKVGTVCYSIARGLGHLAKDFYDHGVITHPFVQSHGRIPEQPWYPDAPRMDALSRGELYERVSQLDAMLFFETPFDWLLVDFCRQVGVKTVLVTMYECTPERVPYLPDVFCCPSVLDVDYFKPYGVRTEFVPLPVNQPWKLRESALHYIHNGGYLGLRGREGTTLLIEAMQYVKSPLKLTIRCQENVDDAHKAMALADPRVEYIAGTVPYADLYATGDVAVVPQKWNGCSLPLQEAFASGLCCMTTRRYPMTTWLPNEPMIPVAEYRRIRLGGCIPFDEAQIRPEDIAATMDEWYGRDIRAFSLAGKEWAERTTWEVLKPKYMELLSS